MNRLGAIARLVGFFRAGYPDGLPSTGYVPLFALVQCRPAKEDGAPRPTHGSH